MMSDMSCRFDNDHLLAFGGAKNTEMALTSGTSNAAEFAPAFNLTSFEAILAPAAAPGAFRESKWVNKIFKERSVL